MKSRVLVLLLCFSLVAEVNAQALPAFSGAVNKALGQIIQKTALRRGFAANDPRMLTTFTSASTVAASVAADVAITAATAASAPVWLSAAAGLGAAAVIGGLAYGAYRIFFDDSSSQARFVVKTGTGASPGTPWTPSGQFVYYQPGLTFDAFGRAMNSSKDRIPKDYVFFFGSKIYGDDPAAMMQLGVAAWISLGGGTGAKFKGCDAEGPIDANGQSIVSCHAIRIGSGGNTQPESEWMVSDVDVYMIPNPYKAGTTFKGKITDIVPNLSSEMSKPADAATLAVLANGLWQLSASEPDYQGIPYSATDPVTTADAEAVQSANPTTWPTNGDLISPMSPGAGQAVVISPTYNPATSPDTGSGSNTNPSGTVNVNVVNTPSVNVANQVKIDWGNDPLVAAPSLESSPTAQQILQPLLGLMPSLRNFVVPAHASECPKPVFTVFNKSVTMDSHCTLLDGVRPTLYALMALVWLMLGTTIVLRA